MAFGTYHPCHGCGKTVRRPVEKVCAECEAILRSGRAQKESDDRKSDKGRIFRLTREWPMIYAPTGNPDTTKNLLRAFETLSRACLKPSKSKITPYDKDVAELPPKGGIVTYFSTFDPDATLWAGTQRVADAITKLDLAVRRTIQEVYKAGEESGSNMLMQLAGGKVSIAELTDAQIEAGRRKRS